jgi:hypothetical protein
VRTPITTYAWMRPLLLLTASTASNSYVDVTGDLVRVRMGFAFGSTFPKDVVRHAARWEGRAPLSIGVHGWRGRWLVNGARRPLVVIDLDPTQRARVLGVPVKLSQLTVSADDPDTLVNEFTTRP